MRLLPHKNKQYAWCACIWMCFAAEIAVTYNGTYTMMRTDEYMYGRNKKHGLHAGAFTEFQDLPNFSRGVALASSLAHQQSAKDDTLVQASIDAAAIT